MHLTYPKEPDKFTKEELICLSAALGFHENIFAKHIPSLSMEGCCHVETKVLCWLIESKVFHSDLHRSYNLHDGVYNAEVLLKAVHVLSKRLLSFAEVKTIRVAFQFYECADLSGLETNVETILQTLKMCGCVISPKQITDHLRHMPRLAPDRLMLFEFIDIFQLCDKICDVKKIVHPETTLKDYSHGSSFQVGDFKEILQQEDEKILEYLDQVYQKKCFRPPFVTKPNWRIPPREMIRNKEWKNQVTSNREFVVGLNETIDKSNKKENRMHAGLASVQTTPYKVHQAKHLASDDHAQFVDLNVVNNQRGALDITTLTQMIEPSNYERKDYLKTISNNEKIGPNVGVFSKTPSYQAPLGPPVSSIPANLCENCLSKPPTYLSQKSQLSDVQILVSQEELHETHTKIVNLLWDLEMKGQVENKTSKDKKDKFGRSDHSENIKKRTDISGNVKELKGNRTAVKDEQELLKTISRDGERCPTTPSVYNFLNSRSEKRDTLLGRTLSPKTKRISRT